MRYFRADKRDFDLGDPIRTAGQFQHKHNEMGKAMEEALSKARPAGKPNRSDCLMLFEDESCAKKHWSKMSDGKLYSVFVDEEMVLHRGDMHLAESIGVGAFRGDNVSDLSRRYWEGDLTESPCVEILTREGTIAEQIGTEQQRQEEFKRRYISRKDGPEPFQEEMERLFHPTPASSGKGGN